MSDLPLPLNFRSEIITPLVAKLRAGESCSLVGVGSSGKSNVVRYLRRHDVRQYYFREDAPRVLYLYVDCESLSDSTDAQVYAEVLNVLSKEIRSLGEVGESLQPRIVEWWREALTPGGKPFVQHNVQNAIDLVLTIPIQSIIIVFDDCDSLIRDSAPSLLRSLRALRNDYKQRLMYTTVTRLELNHLRSKSSDFETFLELFAAYYLAVKPYQESDATFMLKRLAARQTNYSRSISDLEIQRLVQVTGGHAGLLKQAYEVTKHGELALESNLGEMLSTRDLIRAECRKICESLAGTENDDLRSVARGQNPEGKGIAGLKSKGLVNENPDHSLSIFSPILGSFVKAQMSPIFPQKGPEIEVDSRSQKAKFDGLEINLEQTEFLIFQFLYRRRPQACSYNELIKQLVELEPRGGSPHRRLEQYMKGLSDKINRPGKTYLIATPKNDWRLIGENGE